MAKFKFKLKKSWKNIVSIALACLTLAGAIVGISVIAKKAKEDTKEISPTFYVGAIDASGNYMESDTSIYTKNLFECDGLSIEPDFEATGTYQVFYYDSQKNFIESTEPMNAYDGVYNKEDTVFGAFYCRVMITPDAPLDEDGLAVKDFKIRFYEVIKYANAYKILVNKVQKNYVLTDFEHSSRTTGKTYDFDDNGHLREDPADATVTVYSGFDVSEYSYLAFRMEVSGGAGNGHFLFVDENEKLVEDVAFSLGNATYIEDGVILLKDVSVPQGAVRCYIVGCTAMSYMSVYGM